MKTHEDLEVWQQAINLSVSIYKITAAFPADERFGLTSQMRRAAVSIASNIAEGAARHSRREFAQFLSVAAGSASELSTQLIIAAEIGMGDKERLLHVRQSVARISQMLQKLMQSVREKEHNDTASL